MYVLCNQTADTISNSFKGILLTFRGIDLASFYHYSIVIVNCSDIAVFLFFIILSKSKQTYRKPVIIVKISNKIMYVQKKTPKTIMKNPT